MRILKKMGAAGVVLLVLNEIRGILVVAALLSGGAQALAQSDAPPAGSIRPHHSVAERAAPAA